MTPQKQTGEFIVLCAGNNGRENKPTKLIGMIDGKRRQGTEKNFPKG